MTLAWANDVDKELKEMKQLAGLMDYYTNQNIGDHPSILTFGFFLSEMGLSHQAKRFYVYLRKTLPIHHPDRGDLCNNLGEVSREIDYFNQARHEFEEALDFCVDNLSIHHLFWAVLHSNIALLRLTCGQPKEALRCYRCATLVFMRLTE